MPWQAAQGGSLQGRGFTSQATEQQECCFTFTAAIWVQQSSPQLASLPTAQAGSQCWWGSSPVAPETLHAEAGPSPKCWGKTAPSHTLPHAGPCTAKRNHICRTSSYSIFCFLLIVQRVASSQALLWIQNRWFPYRLFDRLTESSGWAVHKHVYCQASSPSKSEAEKERSQCCSFLPLRVPLQRPRRAWFSRPLYKLKAQLPLVALTAVHHQHFHSSDPRLIPWKKSQHKEQTNWGSPVTSQTEGDLLTVDRAADRGQEQSDFPNALFAAPFICFLTSETSEQRSYRNHLLPFPAHS